MALFLKRQSPTTEQPEIFSLFFIHTIEVIIRTVLSEISPWRHKKKKQNNITDLFDICHVNLPFVYVIICSKYLDYNIGGYE